VIAEVKTTYETYEGSEMQGLINALNETDKAAMEARLVALVTTAQEAATAMKADVQAKYDAAKAAVEALEAEATAANVEAAKAALDAADAQYETVKALFSEEEQATYAAASVDYSGRITAVEDAMNAETPDSGNQGETPETPDDGNKGETPETPDSGNQGETPETPDSGNQGETPETPDDGNKDETIVDKVISKVQTTLGCAGTISGISTMLTLVAAAAVVVMKKKD